MAAAYTKDFLVDAFVHRYRSIETAGAWLRKLAERHYDEVGKDKFRVSASLDADALKKYRLELQLK